jgi:hypothetical protein
MMIAPGIGIEDALRQRRATEFATETVSRLMRRLLQSGPSPASLTRPPASASGPPIRPSITGREVPLLVYDVTDQEDRVGNLLNVLPTLQEHHGEIRDDHFSFPKGFALGVHGLTPTETVTSAGTPGSPLKLAAPVQTHSTMPFSV